MKVCVKSTASILLALLCCITSCKKEKDYRDKFTGTYICDYMRVDQTQIILPDSTMYLYDTSFDFNVSFTVEKAEDARKLIILDINIEVLEDGSLEYWVPGRQIIGNFHHNDSISISQGLGKENGYTEYWWGKK